VGVGVGDSIQSSSKRSSRSVEDCSVSRWDPKEALRAQIEASKFAGYCGLSGKEGGQSRTVIPLMPPGPAASVHSVIHTRESPLSHQRQPPMADTILVRFP
jgi:hypothetical protein